MTNSERLLDMEKSASLVKILKSDKGEYRYVIDLVDDIDSLKVLTYAIRNGVNVEKIENLNIYNSEQLKVLCYGLNRGLDISKVANPAFSNVTMIELLKEVENGDDIDEFVEAIQHTTSDAVYYAIRLRRFGCEYSHILHPNSRDCKTGEIYRSLIYSLISNKFLSCGEKFSVPYNCFQAYNRRYITNAFERDDDSIYIVNQLNFPVSVWVLEKLDEVFETTNWKPREADIYRYIIDYNENVLYFLPDIIRYKIDPENVGLYTITDFDEFRIRLKEIIAIEKKFNLFDVVKHPTKDIF